MTRTEVQPYERMRKIAEIEFEYQLFGRDDFELVKSLKLVLNASRLSLSSAQRSDIECV